MAETYIATTVDNTTAQFASWLAAEVWLRQRGGEIERRIPKWDGARHRWEWRTVRVAKVVAAGGVS